MISDYILYYRGLGVRIEHDSCQLLRFDRVHRDVIDTKLSGQQPVWPRGPTVSCEYGGRGCNYWIAYKRRCSKEDPESKDVENFAVLVTRRSKDNHD